MPTARPTPIRPQTDDVPVEDNRRLWWSYAGICLLAWLLYVLAGTELRRGPWQLLEVAYQATLTLWLPSLLGVAVWPCVNRLDRLGWGSRQQLAGHLVAALLFSLAWLVLDTLVAWVLFGGDHALAMLSRGFLFRIVWGMLVYSAMAVCFTAVRNARRARASELAVARAESALARAELAAISGKLNPHFLFNTLNSLVALTRKDAGAAEKALLRFSSMLRYVLDTKRASDGRVALQDELDFLQDYLTLESLRLGPRLQVQWEIEDAVRQDDVPPLTLQPLVENSIMHAVAPQPQGGTISVQARRDALRGGLALVVSDNGPGCAPERLEQRAREGGIGLLALRKRFALDFEGRASLRIHTAPGAGFRVDIWIPPA